MSNLVKTALLASVAVTSLACSSDDGPTEPAAITYTATMNAANERQANPVNSPATGLATFTLRGNDTLQFTVTVSGLMAAASAAHIHVGGTEVSGPVVNGIPINTGVTTGTLATGTIVLSRLAASGTTQISGDSLRVLLNNGMSYVNVHTPRFPAGEVRGQIVRQ